MKNCKKHLLQVLAAVISLLAALFWVALRINYSGISKFLGADTNQSFLVMNLPVLVCAAAWLGFGFALYGAWRKKKWASVTGLVVGVAMTLGAGVVIYFGARDYMEFILPHFLRTVAAAAALAALFWGLLRPVPKKAAAAIVAAVTLAAVIWGYGLRPCKLTYGAVVYAVEEDYQIVFSTSDSAVGWVEIGGECYYDLYAGSARSIDRVHKVTVPQSVLDGAGAYTVCAQQMIYRGPFGGYKGNTLSRDYAFRGVDVDDGFRYVALSDVHSAVEAAARSVSGTQPDLLVLLGDLISMVETEEDAQLANRLAHSITGGEYPVIYVRGNHEIKGEYAEDLYKYVGSRNQSFAYPVTLAGGQVAAVVLDMGEDHEDDWWEYYGTAHFDRYRREQAQMLAAMAEDPVWSAARYRMALCHVPIVYVDPDGRFDVWRQEWTALLNDLAPDISLSGHEHRMLFFLPGTLEPGAPLVYTQAYAGVEGKQEGGWVTDFRFPTFLAGRRSLAQTGPTQTWGMDQYLGLHCAVELEAGHQEVHYVNSLGQEVPMIQPFVGSLGEGDWGRIKTVLAD